MGRSRYKITEPQLPHFVTLTVLHWIPVFTRPDTVDILLNAIRFLSKDGLKVFAYVVLENHCHFVLQSDALDRDISRLKSWTARQLIQYFAENNVARILEQLAFYKKAHKKDRAYQFWQEGVHPELIQNDDVMRQKIDISTIILSSGVMWIRLSIGAIPVHVTMPVKRVCWRYTGNGEVRMRSHAGAWERVEQLFPAVNEANA